MNTIPIFDEFGFKPATPFKIPAWAWVAITIVICAIISFLVFKAKEEKKVDEDKSSKSPLIPLKA